MGKYFVLGDGCFIKCGGEIGYKKLIDTLFADGVLKKKGCDIFEWTSKEDDGCYDIDYHSKIFRIDLPLGAFNIGHYLVELVNSERVSDFDVINIRLRMMTCDGSLEVWEYDKEQKRIISYSSYEEFDTLFDISEICDKATFESDSFESNNQDDSKYSYVREEIYDWIDRGNHDCN